MIELSHKQAAMLDLRHQHNVHKLRNGDIYTTNDYGWKPFTTDPLFNNDFDFYDACSMGLSTYHQSPEIMTIGCSFTASVCLPRKYSWPQIVGLLTGKSVNNCSRGASSPMYQVAAAIEMMNEFGTPKTIYALFPEFTRGLVCTEETIDGVEYRIQNHLMWSPLTGSYISSDQMISMVLNELVSKRKKRNKYAIFTYKHADGSKMLLPSEWFVQANMEAVQTLSMFCELSGIELKFCSWEALTNIALMKLPINGFVLPTNRYSKTGTSRLNNVPHDGLSKVSPFQWINPLDGSCGHGPVSATQEKIWEMAYDDVHPGLHSHIHFAEHFLGTQIPQSFINSLG